ncbi:MAG: DUF58 domain-containing protein [Microbacteriaceae bacterium]|jgi:uncharacterized protein (DUF58 family)|nr:DUF58 domain-containing protein [Microbacteriaceae bacterium]HPZ33680.1 DUF58 domain-containing protein [Microbacteriaceae bacterium]
MSAALTVTRLPAVAWLLDTAWPATAPARAACGRVLSVVRPLGWAVIVSTVLAWLFSATLGWAELRTIAWCGTALIVICAFFLIGRTEYRAKLEMAQRRIVVGERAFGRISLANPSRRAILPARVLLPVGAGSASFAVPRLGADAQHEDLFTVPTARRAILTVGPLSALRGDPLGLFERVHTWTDPVDLYVHPRTVLLDGATAGYMRDIEGLPTRDLSSDDVSFHAMREYVPGDDMRHIHWRSTARTGTVMVRQFEETRRSHTVIALTRSSAEFATEDEFELAVSVAGSLGLQALRDARNLTVMVQERTITAGTAKQFLDTLSGLEHSRPRQGGVVELAAEVGRSAKTASVVVLVCGSSVSAQQLRDATRLLPFGARNIAVVCEPGATPALRMLGEASVLTIGELGELRGALRRVLS